LFIIDVLLKVICVYSTGRWRQCITVELRLQLSSMILHKRC